jgi:uncharacterized membrane protein YqjE
MKDNPFEKLGSAYLALIREHATLFTLEKALAKQSILPFLISMGGSFLLIISIWITLLVITSYGIYLLTQNLNNTLIIISVIQLVGLALGLFLMKMYLKRMGFKHTRAHLKMFLENDDEP